MRCLYLYNSNSGKGKYKTKKEYIINRLREKFEEVDYIETLSREHTLSVINKCGVNYDAIVFSGGDGTVNDIVNAIMHLSKQPVLGYIPSGTCNDFAKSMKIPQKLDDALDIIINGQAQQTDIFKVNDRYGVYVCGAGIFTSASFDTKQKAKRKIGKLAYYFHSFKEIFCAKSFKVNVKSNNEDFKMNTILMLLINSISVAGYKLNKYVDLHDGQMEFVAITQKHKRLTLKSLILICKLFLFGLKSIKNEKSMKYFKFSNCEIQFDEKKAINIDGENMGKCDCNIVVCRDKLCVFTYKN